jgi:DNA-binding NtrC family response regulator
MIEGREQARFAREPQPGPIVAAALAREHLDRDLTAELEIAREHHDAHAAAAEDADRFESRRQARHRAAIARVLQDRDSTDDGIDAGRPTVVKPEVAIVHHGKIRSQCQRAEPSPLSYADSVNDELSTWVTMRDGRATAVTFRRLRLDVITGPDAGTARSFAQPHIRVGAHRSCDVVLNDPRVSGAHAEIALDVHGYRVRDLGSTNGTFVGGVRLGEACVPAGTVLRLGGSELRLVALAESVEIPLPERDRMHGLVGSSVALRRVYERIERFAPAMATVLIIGETGTGKELVAEAIHCESPRRDGPLVVLDCAAIPPTLFEAELLGYERGAFTGADRANVGALERAHGGTLLLDEVGEVPLELQAKLLRAIETKRVRRIGGSEDIACDVRIVAATNRDLAVEVNRGGFRADLYYRLAVAQILVPPLRDRKEDVPELVEHFRAERGGRALTDEEIARMSAHGWPGNVRELRNVVERMMLDEGVALELESLAGKGSDRIDSYASPELAYHPARRSLLGEFERRYVSAILERHGWNVSAAARAAGVDRMTLYLLMERHQLSRPDR